MKCPNCNETLIMADRQGVEIDYCPNCRGVWLDRGELDKIIERSADHYVPKENYRMDSHKQSQIGHYNDPHKRPPYKKKDSFLGDLFDF